MSKRAAQSPIDSQRKTKKQKKEIETVPDEQAEFLEDTSISFIAGIKNNGAIPLRDTTLMQRAFEQVEKVYKEMHKQSKNQDLTNLFAQLKQINERITNTEVKLALVGQPGAGKTRSANQILFSASYLRNIDASYEWGKAPLVSASGDHMTRKIYYLKKGPKWSIKVRWDKHMIEVPAEINLMEKYTTSTKIHPFEVMTSIISKLDPTIDHSGSIRERAAQEEWSEEKKKTKLKDVRQQEPIFSLEEWNNITAVDIESPDFDLAPGFVLMDTPGFGFEDKDVSRDMVESVVKSTKEAIEEADALIYVTSRLPNIQQIKALFDPAVGAINTLREVPVLVCLWTSYEGIKEKDAKAIVDHLRRLKSDWNNVLPRASTASKVGTQFDYFYERKRIFEQLEQRTLLFSMPGTLGGLQSFYQNVKSRVLMNDVVSFTRTVTTFYYGGKQWARKMLNKNRNVIPSGLSSAEETEQALATAYQEPIEDAKQAFVQTLEDYFQFLIQESEEEIDIYLDNLCKDIGTCFAQFFKDIQTQSLKMVDNLIKRVATELSEANQREETEVFITSIMDGMETQTRVFHTMRLRSDRIFDTAKKEIVAIYRKMRSEGQFSDLQDFDEDDVAPYKKKFVSESFQKLIQLMERCYKQMIHRTHGIIEKCGIVLKEFAELRIDNTAGFEQDLGGLREAVDAYKATLKSQTPTEFKEFSINDPIPRVIKGADFFTVAGDKKNKPAERLPTITEIVEASSKLDDNVVEVSMPESPAFSFDLRLNGEVKKKIEEFKKISEAKLSVKDKKDEDVADKQQSLLTDISSTPPGSAIKRKIIPEPIVLIGDFSEQVTIGLKNVIGAKVLVVIIVLQKYLKKLQKSLEKEDVPQDIKNDVLIVAVQHPKDLSKLTIFPTLLDVAKALMEHWKFSFYWRFSLNVFNMCREYYLPVDTTRNSPLVRCLKFHSDVLSSYCSVCIEKVHALCDIPGNNEIISELYIDGVPQKLVGKPFSPEAKKALRTQNFQLLDKLKKKECSFQELIAFVENLDDLVDKRNPEQYLFVESLKDILKKIATFTLVDEKTMLKDTRAAFPMLFRKCTSTNRVTLNNTYAMKGLWFRKKSPLQPFDASKDANKDFYDGLKKYEAKIARDLRRTGSSSIKITYFGYAKLTM